MTSIPDIKRKIGYLPEGAYYPDFLRGEEILRFYGNLYGLRGKSSSAGSTRPSKQSGWSVPVNGCCAVTQRHAAAHRLAQALLSDPQILILDEPTTGLDPVARRDTRPPRAVALPRQVSSDIQPRIVGGGVNQRPGRHFVRGRAPDHGHDQRVADDRDDRRRNRH